MTDNYQDDPDAGRLHIRRLSERKSWTKLYQDKVNEMATTRDEAYVPPERKNLAVSIAMGSIIAQKLGKHVRRRLRNKKYSCRRTIDNLKIPLENSKWNSLLGLQLICDICGLSALNDCTSCITCNSVAHRLCVGHLFGKNEKDVNSYRNGNGNNNNNNNNKNYSSGGMGIEEGSEEDSDYDEDEDKYDDGNDDNDDDENFSENSNSEDEQIQNRNNRKNRNSNSNSNSIDIGNTNFKLSYDVTVGLDEFKCGSCRLIEEEDNDHYFRLQKKLSNERRYVLAVRGKHKHKHKYLNLKM